MANFNRRKPKPGAQRNPKPLRMFRHSLRRTRREDDDPAAPVRRRRGIYLLPNAFTTAALFCGFYAIVMAMNLKFDQSAIAIFAAMVFWNRATIVGLEPYVASVPLAVR